MGPGEAIVAFTSIVSVFIGMPWVIFSGVRKLREQKSAGRGSGGDLSASELRAMIHDAVGDAISPLADRVTDLEERLGDESVADLRARLDPALLDDLADDVADAVTSRARTRA